MLRKTEFRLERRRGVYSASMRPQRNAAENRSDKSGDPTAGCASMRPQRNAAENGPIPPRVHARPVKLQ